MRAKQFLPEAPIGTSSKRPARAGSRPERGHEPQKRYVTDRKTGKQYDPDEEFDKLRNSDEFQGVMKRMATKESSGDLDQYDVDQLQGYYSDFHKDLLGHRPRGASEEEWNDSDWLKMQINKLHDYFDRLKSTPQGRAQLKSDGWQINDEPVDEIAGAFPSPSTRAKWAADAAASNAAEAKRQAALQAQADAERLKTNTEIVDKEQRVNHHLIPANEDAIAQMEAELALMEKASRQLCKSSKPDEDLGASNLASCKSQGLRARDGEKSHLIGHGNSEVRIKVGGKRIKGKKYGGPLPDYGTRKGQ